MRAEDQLRWVFTNKTGENIWFWISQYNYILSKIVFKNQPLDNSDF